MFDITNHKLIKMKNILMLFTLFFGISVVAQNIVNITYYEIPRENSAEFLRSHQKFTDLSMSENRLILGAGVFAHVHADNYTYVSYEFYNSVADIEKDGAIASKALKANVDALKLSEEEKKEFSTEYANYSRIIYYNHSDQMRMANPKMEWNFYKVDWTKKKITTLSKFKIKDGMQNQFFKTWEKGEFKNKKESGFVEAMTGSWHLYGDGSHIHVYTFFNNWDSFASFEKASDYEVTKNLGENDKKFWSTVDSHEDEILMFIGGIDQTTRKFYFAK